MVICRVCAVFGTLGVPASKALGCAKNSWPLLVYCNVPIKSGDQRNETDRFPLSTTFNHADPFYYFYRILRYGSSERGNRN